MTPEDWLPCRQHCAAPGHEEALDVKPRLDTVGASNRPNRLRGSWMDRGIQREGRGDESPVGDLVCGRAGLYPSMAVGSECLIQSVEIEDGPDLRERLLMISRRVPRQALDHVRRRHSSGREGE